MKDLLIYNENNDNIKSFEIRDYDFEIIYDNIKRKVREFLNINYNNPDCLYIDCLTYRKIIIESRSNILRNSGGEKFLGMKICLVPISEYFLEVGFVDLDKESIFVLSK